MTILVETTPAQDKAIAGIMNALHVGRHDGLDSYAQGVRRGPITLFVDGGRDVEWFTIGPSGSIRNGEGRVDVRTLEGDLASASLG